MKLVLRGHGFSYEMENVARLFFDDLNLTGGPVRGDCIEARISHFPGGLRLLAGARSGGEVKLMRDSVPGDAPQKLQERQLASLLFRLLSELTGRRPPWGIMTGIRPAKYAMGLLAAGKSERQVLEEFCGGQLVQRDKAELALQVAGHSLAADRLCGPRSYSLYVSIPFCPSRCSYCSFVSKTVGRDLAMLDDYLDRLLLELRDVRERAGRLSLRMESVYIGGGTPTVLSAEQLARLTGELNSLFGAADCREFSVEAGRPDTITREKLRALKDAGVTRLSINPQTGSDRVLQLIGRCHSAKDIELAFAMARQEGFCNINADLIAGLTGDTPEGFRRSLEWVLGMAPENVTVHALTLKRASRMRDQRQSGAEGAGEMVRHALETLTARGYQPYYMYKQKGTLEGLENTGYALPGRDCLYNIFIMEELHTIVACGAGAVSKLVDRGSGFIDRIFNYKYPAEYISGFDNILKRKDKLDQFYNERQI